MLTELHGKEEDTKRILEVLSRVKNTAEKVDKDDFAKKEFPKLPPDVSSAIWEHIFTGKKYHEQGFDISKVETRLDKLPRSKLFKKIVQELKGFGPKITLGLLSELPEVKTLNQFIKTVLGKKNIGHNLTNYQRITLEYYSKTRRKIRKITIQRNIVKKLSNIFPSVEFIPVGSFRRGQKIMKDVDILVCPKKGKRRQINLIKKLVQVSEDIFGSVKLKGGISKGKVASILFPISVKQPSSKKMFVQVDYKIVDRQSLPFGLLHFTGNANFNRAMRMFCIKRGYKINEYGLFNRKTGRKVKNNVGEKGEFSSEREIFKFLGLNYIPPKGRQFVTNQVLRGA